MNREPRVNQVIRLSQIDERIRSGAYPNALSLAAEFDVTDRLIYRERLKLIALGAPIAYDRTKRGWYYRDLTWVFPLFRFTEDELVTFFLAVANARANGNSGMEGPLQRLTEKLFGTLGEHDSLDLNALRDSTSFSLPPAIHVKAESYLQLCRAKAARAKVRMHYYSPSSNTRGHRIVHPYDLFIDKGETMLIAWDEKHKTPRNFNVGRISQLEMLGDHFEISPDYDREKYMRSMFGSELGEVIYQVAVQFDFYQGRYIKERQWHRDQTLEDSPDGGVIIRFAASSLPAACRWAMQYGKHARVLEPPELVSLVQTHIHELVKLYAS